jgi:hypothetical protein
MGEEPNRRSQDRDREIFNRLDQQDVMLRRLEMENVQMKGSLEAVNTRMSHSAELLSERFKSIEAGGALLLARHDQTALKVDSIRDAISAMGADPVNTPAGRAMTAKVTDIDHRVFLLDQWKSGFEGVGWAVKTIGIGTLVSLALWAAKGLGLLK